MSSNRPEDIAYVAGLLDGDGWITIVERKGGRRPVYVLHLGIATTSRDLAEFCQGVFDVGSVTHWLPKGRDKKMWTWRCWAVESAKTVLRALHPFLRLKKAQAEIAIEFCSLFAGQVRKISVELQAARQCRYEEMVRASRGYT